MNGRYRLALLVTTLAGFALRHYRLGAESLWYDETVSVVLATKNIPALIAHTAGDIHPPGYYLLLHLWGGLTRPTLSTGLEFLFAWPSLFFGVLLLPLLFAIGNKLHGATVGFLAVILAVINPFHLWYSQEVRMYTLGAALGLLCLWCLLSYWSPPPKARNSRKGILVIYAVAASAGLYSLYYFAFTLIGLNVIAVCWFVRGVSGRADSMSHESQARQPLRQMGRWILAQIGVLVLWGPWVPVFWRQATDPPVPPWRLDWTLRQFGTDLVESGSALITGESVASQAGDGWLVPLVAGLSALVLVRYSVGRPAPRDATLSPTDKRVLHRLTLLLFFLIPASVIYLLTATVTPLYHVRYLFTYAPIFMIILAAVLAWVFSYRSWLGGLTFVGLISLSIYGLNRYWTAPEFRADEHRETIAALAERWRPNDLILVNAGWAYTTFETYWPSRSTGANISAYPPDMGAQLRLLDIQAGESLAFPNSGQTPLLVRTGSVDAVENLGWGDPNSDFFAISTSQARQALDTLASCYSRIWHYRIYDTVSDPVGVIRSWLEANGALQNEQWITGRDLGQLQLYDLQNDAKSSTEACSAKFMDWESIDFGSALRLHRVAVPTVHSRGEILYTTVEWQPLPGLANEPSPLSMSLRLYADTETLLTQQDESPIPSTDTWLASTLFETGIQQDDTRQSQLRLQTLALPIPNNLSPGSYSLELLVYRQHDGAPLPLPDLDNTIWGQRLRLSHVQVETPSLRAAK